jgi:hypothetical protein
MAYNSPQVVRGSYAICMRRHTKAITANTICGVASSAQSSGNLKDCIEYIRGHREEARYSLSWQVHGAQIAMPQVVQGNWQVTSKLDIVNANARNQG